MAIVIKIINVPDVFFRNPVRRHLPGNVEHINQNVIASTVLAIIAVIIDKLFGFLSSYIYLH